MTPRETVTGWWDMAPSPSAEQTPAAGSTDLGPADRDRLLSLAEGGVRDGLREEPPRLPAPSKLAPALRRPIGVFVTLTVAGDLNGCIGTVEPDEPLGRATPRCAWQAAFADPRLPPLTHEDLDDLHLDVSVLSELTEVPAGSARELLGQIRPGIDGLRISAGRDTAVFLPSVWRQLPEPSEFLARLMRKAGLSSRRWPSDMRAELFTTASMRRRFGARASHREPEGRRRSS